MELPLGPSSLPTKLNCNRENEISILAATYKVDKHTHTLLKAYVVNSRSFHFLPENVVINQY